jgi:parvulin-like peptidyl-prolyl isomerase
VNGKELSQMIRKKMLFISIYTALMVTLAGAFASRPPADAIVETKAGYVTSAELDTALDRYLRQIRRVSGGKEVGDSELVELRVSTLNDLIYRKIFTAMAQKKKLSVLDSEVKERYDIVCTGLFEGDTAKFRKSLEEDGWTEETYLANLREIVLSEKARSTIMDGLDPTPEEVNAYFEQRKAEFTVDEIELAHILVSAPQDDMPERGLKTVTTVFRERGVPSDSLEIMVKTEIDSRIARLNAVRDSAIRGTDFGELAKRHSDDGSAEQGGALGVVPRGRTVKAFENAAFALKMGEVSGIVTTEFGFHIIKALSEPVSRIQELGEVEFTIASRIRAQREAEKLKEIEKKWNVRHLNKKG